VGGRGQFFSAMTPARQADSKRRGESGLKLQKILNELRSRYVREDLSPERLLELLVLQSGVPAEFPAGNAIYPHGQLVIRRVTLFQPCEAEGNLPPPFEPRSPLFSLNHCRHNRAHSRHHRQLRIVLSGGVSVRAAKDKQKYMEYKMQAAAHRSVSSRSSTSLSKPSAAAGFLAGDASGRGVSAFAFSAFAFSANARSRSAAA